MSDLREAFFDMWGVPPHPFQERVAESLLAGRNVILQAPTGSGKTMAALYPFLHAQTHSADYPAKCLYSVPMRVLANQFVAEFRDKVNRVSVEIQTGEQSHSRTFEHDLIFATIDQVLSSFLHAPYSLSRRQANLNAGAVVAS